MIINLIAFYYCTCDSENDSCSISALVCDSIWRAWTTSQYSNLWFMRINVEGTTTNWDARNLYNIYLWTGMISYQTCSSNVVKWCMADDIWQMIYVYIYMNIMLHDLNAFWGLMIWYEMMWNMLWYRTWHDMIGCQIESYHIICNPLISLHQWTIYR